MQGFLRQGCVHLAMDLLEPRQRQRQLQGAADLQAGAYGQPRLDFWHQMTAALGPELTISRWALAVL